MGVGATGPIFMYALEGLARNGFKQPEPLADTLTRLYHQRYPQRCRDGGGGRDVIEKEYTQYDSRVMREASAMDRQLQPKKPQTAIERQTGNIREQITRLEALVSGAGSKFAAVLMPMGKNGGDNASPPVPVQSPLADELRGYGSRLERLGNDLEAILNSAEC